MGRIINIIESKNRIQITIVILIIVVISIWVSYNIYVKENRHHISKKASRESTFVKTINLLRTNFELYTEPPHKSETRIYGIPTATAYSSTDLSAGIVNQNNTTSNQPGLRVDTYPVGIAVNPVTRKIYATNELSNSLSVISSTSNNVEDTITVGN